jgi:hypothetical protein
MMNIADDILTEKKNISEIKIKDYEYDDDELIDNLLEEIENKNEKIKSLEHEVNNKNDEELELQKKLSESKIKDSYNNENEKINQKIVNEDDPKIEFDKTDVKIKEELNEEKNKNKLLSSKKMN